MIKKYKKKPVIIEAVLWDGSNLLEVQYFVGKKLEGDFYAHADGSVPSMSLTIPTLEGDMIASLGDFIIKGIQGEFYPCKPEIFNKTYEEVV
jgi:hypothetical protein